MDEIGMRQARKGIQAMIALPIDILLSALGFVVFSAGILIGFVLGRAGK